MSMPFKQSGAVLIIALVVLLLLSMLGISSMQGVVLEIQKTASFTDDRALFLHAESVLSHITREIKRSHHLIDECTEKSNESDIKKVCVSTLAETEKLSYQTSGAFRPYATQGSIKGSYTLYLVELTQPLNPELNTGGLGTYIYYELTVKAEDQETNKVKYLRSIITRSYN